MPVTKGEGPVGMILCPSRELARQTFEIINGMVATLQSGAQGRRLEVCGQVVWLFWGAGGGVTLC